MDPLLGKAPLRPGDVVVLRKPHPCGGDTWTVTRTGADIGLQCARCGRRVMLDREECERRIRRRTLAGDGAPESAQ